MLQFGYKYCALFRSCYSKLLVDYRVPQRQLRILKRFVHAIKLLQVRSQD